MRTFFRSLYLRVRSLFLGAAGVFLRPAAAGPALAAPSKILFIRIDRLGDMVLSTPAYKAVKMKFPGAELSVLAAPAPAALLEGDPAVAKVYLWERGKGLSGRLGVIKELRRAGFDLAIDPYYGYELKTALIAFLSGAKLKAGYDMDGRGVFFDLKARPSWSGAHFADEAFGVLRLLGIAGRSSDPELHVTPRAEAEASAILEGAGAGKEELLVSVHPGGFYPSQRWPADRFAEVVRALAAEYKARILLVGGAAEAGVIETIMSLLGPAEKGRVIKAEGINPGTLSALLRRSRLFIGNNSGPLHMAAALGVPSVSTMGPTDPAKWSPVGPRHTVLRTALPCAGCGKGDCRRGCMLDITSAQLLSAAKDFLL